MDFESMLCRVRGEFAEMPGLRLTPAQASRLWGIEREVCQTVIDVLIKRAFLRWTTGGELARADQ
jgi:hypothetical protein